MQNRFDLLIELSRKTGLTIDYLEFITKTLSQSNLVILCGNASRLPNIMKSIESPWVSRKAMQASSDGRDKPDSQL